MADLFFQTLEVREGVGSKNDMFTSPGPSVRVMERATTVLAGSAIAHRVNQELSILAPRIRAAMPVIGGVLVCVALHEAREVSDDGLREQGLVSLDIVGTGRIPSLVFGMLGSQQRRVPRAPRGWRTRMVYLWATT